MTELVGSTMTQLMAGDGLLIDMSTVQAYVDEIVETPVVPASDPAARDRGAELFKQAQCDTCHAGAQLTDNQAHPVLTPATLSIDDAFTSANTPALHALKLRAPLFHDGRADGLRDALTRPDADQMWKGERLTPPQLDDLIVYLESL
jgi:mono/diheme cytochrome c family protein